MDLILASASPRRLDLLKRVGIIPTKVIPADIDESTHKGETPLAYVKRIAQEKALTIYNNHKTNNSVIIAADTTVAVGRRILQKAADVNEERAFLKLLSGKRHKVITGVSVIDTNGKVRTKAVTSFVKFKKLSEEDINEYINSNQWQGMAGGYSLQGLAEKYIIFIGGSYSNIVGLPLYESTNMLKGIGYE